MEKEILVVQEKIEADKFLRVFCVGKEKSLVTKYSPAPKGTGRIIMNDCSPELTSRVEKWSLAFCKKVDLDLNVVEWAVRGEDAFVIDSYNPIPDVNKSMPEEYYSWVVDELAGFVNKVYDSSMKNKQFF